MFILSEKENRAFINAINDSQYFLKDQARSFVSNQKWTSHHTNVDDLPSPQQYIIDKLSDGDDEVIPLLLDYEFEKYYKYCVLFTHIGFNQHTKLKELISNNIICSEDNGTINDNWSKPTLKRYEQSFDLKFTFYVGTGEKIKRYPVIISFLCDINVVALKYFALEDSQQIENKDHYFELKKNAFQWLKNNISSEVVTAPTLSAFKKIFISLQRNKYESTVNSPEDVVAFAVKAIDTFRGETSLKMTQDDDLPLLDSLRNLSISFCQSDQKRLKDFLLSFIEKSKYEKVGLEWYVKYNKSDTLRAHVQTLVELKKYYTNDNGKVAENIAQIHFYSKSHINREKTNHVIREVSKYL